jgi:hypothetical protein
VLTGGYMYGAAAEEFNARPVPERLAIAREQGERLHAGYARHVEHGLAVGWNRMEFARMGWANEGDRSVGTRRRWRSRRAASTWPATSSPIGAAGRKARS